MSEKRKVAVVLPYFGPGGAEKMVAQLVSALDQEQLEPEVFCVYGQPLNNHLEKMLLERNIPIHYIGKKKGFSLSAMFRLFRALDTFAPDVVHTHQYACVYTALWPLLRKKPFLHTFHTLPEVENKRLIRRLLTRYLVRAGIMTPVAISAENRRMIAAYYGIASDRVPVVPNPVDVQRFTSAAKIPDGVFRFITAGRFSAVKNQKMMFRAFAAFLSEGFEGRLVLLGKGEEEANLRVLADDLQIADRIDYAGYVPNVEDYLANADVFLLSSHYEAQPLSILEAMAAGLPIISTDVGGVRDIVTDNGILVPPGDTDAMAQAMVQLYTQPERYAKLAACSSRNAAAYDISHTAAGYTNLYRNCEHWQK